MSLSASMNNFLMEEFNGKRIRIRDIDGYVNASDLCKTHTKRIDSHEYFRNNDSKLFINELSTTTGIPVVKLVEKIIGGKTPGTWLHPRLAIDFARWVSPELAVKMKIFLKKSFRFLNITFRYKISK